VHGRRRCDASGAERDARGAFNRIRQVTSDGLIESLSDRPRCEPSNAVAAWRFSPVLAFAKYRLNTRTPHGVAVRGIGMLDTTSQAKGYEQTVA